MSAVIANTFKAFRAHFREAEITFRDFRDFREISRKSLIMVQPVAR
jgi:hypothetical protein